MIINRKWSSKKLSIDKRWLIENDLARHRIYQIWNDKNLFPCDTYGIRDPENKMSFYKKFKNSKKKNNKVFCFGGSTTFGWYLNYKESYM